MSARAAAAATLLAAAFCLGAAPALSAPSLNAPARTLGPFEAFEQICVPHQGDQDGARAEALRLGLVQLSDPPADDPNHEIDMAFGLPGERSWVLTLTHPAIDLPAARITGCAVQAADDDQSLYKAFVAWPGLEGDPSENQRMNFAYRQTAQGRTDLPADDVLPVLRSGELRGMIVMRGDYGTFATLVTFAPR